MNENPDSNLPDNKISRREFLLRTGAAGALIAGSAVGGMALWQRKHIIPGFEPQKGLQLPSYALAISEVVSDCQSEGSGPQLALVVALRNEQASRC